MTATRFASRARRWLIVAGLTMTALVGLATAASAHAVLVGSVPLADGTVSTPPDRVTLTFDEAVGVEGSSVQVLDAHGHRVDDGDTRHGAAGSRVVVGLHRDLPGGTYVVSWRAVSADSHPVSGAFAFGVGTAPDEAVAGRVGHRSGSAVVGWADDVGRLATEAGVALAIGGGVFLAALWPEGLSQARDRDRAGLVRARPWLAMWAGWGAAAVGAVALLLLEGPYGAGLGFTAAAHWPVLSVTLHSRYGHLVVLRLVLLALAVPPLRALPAHAAAGGRRARAGQAQLGVLAVAVAATVAAAGHGGTGTGAWLATTSLTLHIVAVSTWTGGLVMLAAFLPRRDDAPLLARILPRWSVLAGTCVVTVIGTGIYQGWRETGSFGALTGTTYGQLLLAKILLFGVMLGCAWQANRWMVRRYRLHVQALSAPAATGARPSRRGAQLVHLAYRTDVGLLRRTVAAEAGLAGAVLAVTAVLAAAQPGATAYAPPVSRTVRTGPLTVRIDVAPARRGPETIGVHVSDRRGRVRPVAEVSGQIAVPARGIGPLPVPFTAAAPGQAVAAAVNVPFPGEWTLTVTIRVDDFDQYSAIVTYRVR